MDTVQTRDYEWVTLKHYELLEEGGMSEWLEVLCPKDRTEKIIRKIQGKLRLENFYTAGNTGKIDYATKQALIAYQIEYALPMGDLNLETLDVMEIRF